MDFFLFSFIFLCLNTILRYKDTHFFLYIVGRKRKSYREKQLKQKRFVLLIQQDNTDVAGQIETLSIPELPRLSSSSTKGHG